VEVGAGSSCSGDSWGEQVEVVDVVGLYQSFASNTNEVRILRSTNVGKKITGILKFLQTLTEG